MIQTFARMRARGRFMLARTYSYLEDPESKREAGTTYEQGNRNG